MRGLAKNAVLLVAGVLVGALLCELLLRITGYAGAREWHGARFDPRYGTVRADSWVFDPEPGPGVETLRLRGEDIALAKPPGETRVLFIGDSGTEGAKVRRGEAFPERFEALLARELAGADVRALNAGAWGLTTIGEYHLLEERLLALEPDVVVLGLFMSNDINFNLGHGSWPGVQTGSGGIASLRQRSALVHFLFLQALSLNARYRWIGPGTLETWLPPELTLIDAHGFHMLSYPAGEVATYMKEPSPLVDAAFELLGRVFTRFQELETRHGFRFGVLLIPTPSAVAGELTLLHYPDIYEQLRSVGIQIQAADLDFDLPTRRVLSICRQLELLCLDPTPRMRAIGMTVFFPDDEHPTARGHGALARELLDARDRLLPRAATADPL